MQAHPGWNGRHKPLTRRRLVMVDLVDTLRRRRRTSRRGPEWVRCLICWCNRDSSAWSTQPPRRMCGASFRCRLNVWLLKGAHTARHVGCRSRRTSPSTRSRVAKLREYERVGGFPANGYARRRRLAAGRGSGVAARRSCAARGGHGDRLGVGVAGSRTSELAWCRAVCHRGATSCGTSREPCRPPRGRSAAVSPRAGWGSAPWGSAGRCPLGKVTAASAGRDPDGSWWGWCRGRRARPEPGATATRARLPHRCT